MTDPDVPIIAGTPAAIVPAAAFMSSAWWIVYAVALAALGASYLYLLIPQPARGWDELGRGIARLLLGLGGAGGYGLLALCALPGAFAGRIGQWRFVLASLLTAGTWGLLTMVDA